MKKSIGIFIIVLSLLGTMNQTSHAKLSPRTKDGLYTWLIFSGITAVFGYCQYNLQAKDREEIENYVEYSNKGKEEYHPLGIEEYNHYQHSNDEYDSRDYGYYPRFDR